ncbi:MAG: hypothetical protein Q6K80_12480, partial [Thermostichus sp. DG_1_6_bins_120]
NVTYTPTLPIRYANGNSGPQGIPKNAVSAALKTITVTGKAVGEVVHEGLQVVSQDRFEELSFT